MSEIFVSPPPAPCFEPTEEEFRDPLEYIAKIRAIGEKHGIVKIKPPPSWQPPFAINIDEFRFNPRIQRLNELEAQSRVKLNFLDKFVVFWKLQGNASPRIPVVDGKTVDIYLLYKAVSKEGGFEECDANKAWCSIARQLRFEAHTGNILRKYYRNMLLPYELSVNGKMLEHVKTCRSPVKAPPKPPTSQPVAVRSSRRRRNGVNNNNSDESQGETGIKDETTVSREMRRLQFFGAGPKLAGMPEFMEDRPDIKEALCSSEMPSIKITSLGEAAKERDPIEDVFCKICSGGDNEEKLLLCDCCDQSFHTFCLLPPLSSVPKGEWQCPECVTKEVQKPLEAYGFEQGRTQYTLHSFGEMADEFKANYFKKPCHAVLLEEIEREFWHLVNSESEIAVEYGADLSSLRVGSGFPKQKTLEDGKERKLPADQLQYAESPWNLNNLPVQKQSVLSHINQEISGVKAPWVYIGMCFSTFCWHTEDHWSYSINYLHWGEPKTWYGIPSSDAEKFEDTMHRITPELFENHPDLLHHIVTIMSPMELVKNGVKVYKLNQRAGEFVVTFPRAYHAGYNNGYNCAEAVNFCPADWLPFGRICMEHYASVRRFCVFSHDELVCLMAGAPERLDVSLAVAVYRDMVRMVEGEQGRRKKLLEMGVSEACQVYFEKSADDARQCAVCRTTCYLSALTCKCQPGRLVCLDDASQLCACNPSEYCLRYRYTLDDLPRMLRCLKQRVDGYETWTQKVRSALTAADGPVESKRTLAEFLALIDEAKQQCYPGTELLDALVAAAKHAERCAQLAKQLVQQKIMTRHKQNGLANYTNKLSLKELVNFLEQTQKLACQVEESKQIQDFINRVYEFKAEATAVLRDDYVITVTGAEEVEKLFGRAIEFDLKLDEMPALKKLHQRCRWFSQASRCLNHACSLADLRQLIVDATNVDTGAAQLEAMLAQVQTKLVQGTEVDGRCTALLSNSPPPTISAVHAALQALPQCSVETPAHKQLTEALLEAKEWRDEFEELQRQVLHLSHLDSQLASAAALSIRPDPPLTLELLQRCVRQVRRTVDSLAELLLLDRSKFTLVEVLRARDNVGRNSKPDEPILSAKARVDTSWLETEPDNDTLDKTLRDSRDREMSAMLQHRLCNASSSMACCCEIVAVDDPLALRCELCAASRHVPCMTSSTCGVTVPALTPSTWLCSACHRSSLPDSDAVMQVLEDFLAETAGMSIEPGERVLCRRFSIDLNESRLRAEKFLTEKWSALSHEDKHSSLPQLESCLVSALLLGVVTDSLRELVQQREAVMGAAVNQSCAIEAWNKIRFVPVRQSPPRRKRAPAPSKDLPVTSSKSRRPAAGPPEDCAALTCLQPEGRNVQWIQCEGLKCAQWFHYRCVGLTQTQVESIDKYFCFRCS